MILDELLSTGIQLILFVSIPFIFYYFLSEREGFANYIGIKKAKKEAMYLSFLVSLLLAGPVLILLYINQDFKQALLDPTTVTGKIHQTGFGLEGIALVIIIAIFKTSLSEEILFRGFIAKRLIKITNFRMGNILQAVIFGFIHALSFLLIKVDIVFIVIIFMLPTIAAYLIVILNEQKAEGSIMPGWIAHAMGNILSFCVVGFLI